MGLTTLVQAEDDRGVRREIGRTAVSKEDEDLDALDDAAASAAYSGCWHDRVSVTCVAAILASLAIVFLIAIQLARVGSPTWLIWSVAPLAATAIGYRVMRPLREKKRHEVVRVYLDHGRCAACGYVLSTDRPEADGCVLCSECGAAWKAERIGRPDAER